MRSARLLLAAALLLSGYSMAAQQTLISENFEGTYSGWSLAGDWQVGTPATVGPTTVAQGTKCAGTNISGNYSGTVTSIMTSSSVTIPSMATAATLSFSEWYYTYSSYDYCYVEISTNGGTSWSSLRSISGSGQTWTRRTFDLSSYKGLSMQVRFRLYTSSASTSYAGWYVDSILLTATVIDTANVPHIGVAPGSIKIGLTDSLTKALTICNTGVGDSLTYALNVFGAGAPTVNILAWTYGADMTTTGEYTNTAASIRQLLPSAVITTTNTTDPATLANLLKGISVLLIPDQDYSPPSYTYGTALASTFDAFVRAGGTIIILNPYAAYTFMAYAGLDTMTSCYNTSSSLTTTVLNANHPAFDSVTLPLYTAMYTAYWLPTASATVLASYSTSYAVLTERTKGLGHIYTIGHDFYSVNTTTWGKILVNCIKAGVGPLIGGVVSVDTASGKIQAGTCKTVNLTFDRGLLAAGTRVVQLRIMHDAILDPANPVVVPCTLVVDSTTAVCTKGSMAASLWTGDTAVKTVSLKNTGTSLLTFNVVKTKGSVINPGPGTILINEVCNSVDYIELINTGGTDVNIGGWRLVWVDDVSSSGSYTIPANTMIKAGRCVEFIESGYSAYGDSVFVLPTTIGWVTTSNMSVALLNSSGTGVDFFKTSGSSTTPPSGTTWIGSGVTYGYGNYYRNTLADNNTAADWVYSSTYTQCAVNPGQPGTTPVAPGYITVFTDSLQVFPGNTAEINFKYDASSLMTSGQFIDTFQIIHNAKTVSSPITVICTLSVQSNIPDLIPYTPDPTTNRKPQLTWHKVPSATAYILEVSQGSSFANLLIIQQTTDTFFLPLTDFPLGTIYWRVRSNLNAKPSQPDQFYIQSDSIPILIPIKPDTISGKPTTTFSWYKTTGATSYKLQVTRVDTTVPQTLVLTYATDTIYNCIITIPTGKYVWTVAADGDAAKTSYPDTFWVAGAAVSGNDFRSFAPGELSFKVVNATGMVWAQCGLPRAVSDLSVDLFDINGKLVRRVSAGKMTAGYHRIVLTQSALASGVYCFRLRSSLGSKSVQVFIKR